MKLEKMLTTMVLSSALLLAVATAAGAADQPSAAKTVPAVAGAEPAPVLATALGTLESDCERGTSAPLFQVSFKGPATSFSERCGSCSSNGCGGGSIGQMCWTGGINGQWGECNLYSGGYVCQDGGWDCQCGYGPIH